MIDFDVLDPSDYTDADMFHDLADLQQQAVMIAREAQHVAMLSRYVDAHIPLAHFSSN